MTLSRRSKILPFAVVLSLLPVPELSLSLLRLESCHVMEAERSLEEAGGTPSESPSSGIFFISCEFQFLKMPIKWHLSPLCR